MTADYAFQRDSCREGRLCVADSTVESCFPQGSKLCRRHHLPAMCSPVKDSPKCHTSHQVAFTTHSIPDAQALNVQRKAGVQFPTWDRPYWKCTQKCKKQGQTMRNHSGGSRLTAQRASSAAHTSRMGWGLHLCLITTLISLPAAMVIEKS